MIDTTNRNTALASALVEELARCGVRHAFLSPGSRSSPIALALDREAAIELTVILDERVAGFAALGAALATGEPAIVACTSGSAAANLHPAVVEADQAGVPLIVLDLGSAARAAGHRRRPDDRPDRPLRRSARVVLRGRDPRGRRHRACCTCARPPAAPIGEATSGRGPVHLNLAWRDPLGPDPLPGDVTADRSAGARGPLAGSAPDRGDQLAASPGDELLDALSVAVERAERGVIVAGPPTGRSALGARSPSWPSCAGFPILAEPTSQLRFGRHDRSAVIAAYDLIARSQPQSLSPDLVLRFGDMPTSKPLRAWLASLGCRSDRHRPAGPLERADSRRAGAFVRADAGSVDRRDLLAHPPGGTGLEAALGRCRGSGAGGDRGGPVGVGGDRAQRARGPAPARRRVRATGTAC